MKIEVNHIDSQGNQSNKNFHLTRVGFAKYIAIAGQGVFSPIIKII